MRPAYDRACALTRTAAPSRAEDEWPWHAIRDVAVEALLRVVHDLGAPTQARVDAAATLLAASSRIHTMGDRQWPASSTTRARTRSTSLTVGR